MYSKIYGVCVIIGKLWVRSRYLYLLISANIFFLVDQAMLHLILLILIIYCLYKLYTIDNYLARRNFYRIFGVSKFEVICGKVICISALSLLQGVIMSRINVLKISGSLWY